MAEGFGNEYSITPTAFVKGMSMFVIIMFLVLVIVIPPTIYIYEKHLLATILFYVITLGVFIPTLALSWAYSPQKYLVSDREITIVRPIKTMVIPLAEIRKVEAKDFKAYKMIRKWGNGGLFSVSGMFWTKAEGNFRCYGKNNNFVMLHAGEKWVLTPDEKELFMQEVRSKIEKNR